MLQPLPIKLKTHNCLDDPDLHDHRFLDDRNEAPPEDGLELLPPVGLVGGTLLLGGLDKVRGVLDVVALVIQLIPGSIKSKNYVKDVSLDRTQSY